MKIFLRQTECSQGCPDTSTNPILLCIFFSFFIYFNLFIYMLQYSKLLSPSSHGLAGPVLKLDMLQGLEVWTGAKVGAYILVGCTDAKGAGVGYTGTKDNVYHVICYGTRTMCASVNNVEWRRGCALRRIFLFCRCVFVENMSDAGVVPLGGGSCL